MVLPRTTPSPTIAPHSISTRTAIWRVRIVQAIAIILLCSRCQPSFGWTIKPASKSSSSSSQQLQRRRRQILARGIAAGHALVFGSPKDVVADVADAATGAIGVENENDGRLSDTTTLPSQRLLDMIPTMPCGAPATNATIPYDLAMTIEMTATQMETQQSSFYTKNNAISPLLSGSWRLIYSNAPEISSLAAKLPLGFCLGPTFQPLDTTAGFFENRAPLVHPWHLGKLQVNVIGTVGVSEPGSLNAVGVVNNNNNRVTVEFQAITFTLQELLGITSLASSNNNNNNNSKSNNNNNGGILQKTLIPKTSPNAAAPPANDVTYLDGMTRLVRGGDGSLFIFVRESERLPMLTKLERDELFGKNSNSPKNNGRAKQDVDVGIGVAETSQSPELQFLFQKQK